MEPRQRIVALLRLRMDQMGKIEDIRNSVKGEKVRKVLEAYDAFNGHISNSDIVRVTEVSPDHVALVITILKHGMEDEVKALRDGSRTLRSIINAVRARVERKRGWSGGRIRVKPGVSVIDEVRRHLNGAEVGAEEISKKIGVSNEVVSFIRKLLIVRSREDLASEDRIKIDDAIKYVDTERRITGAKKIAGEVVRRLWVHSRGGLETKRVTDLRSHRNLKAKRRLDNTLFAIREACSNNEEMAIPSLTNEEREEAVTIILESQFALVDLVLRLRLRQQERKDEHKEAGI